MSSNPSKSDLAALSRQQDAILCELSEIRRQNEEVLRQLRALLALHAPSPRAPLASQEKDVALVRAIVGAGAQRRFTSAAIMDLIMPPLQRGGNELREALNAAIRKPNARRLGKFLERVAGQDLEGLQIVRLDEDREGAIWSVRELRE